MYQWALARHLSMQNVRQDKEGLAENWNQFIDKVQGT